jgi:hypothetical protein
VFQVHLAPGIAMRSVTPGKFELISSAHCRSTWPSGQHSVAGRWHGAPSLSMWFPCLDDQSKYAIAVEVFPIPGVQGPRIVFRVAFGSMLSIPHFKIDGWFPAQHRSRRRSASDRAPVSSPIPIQGLATMRFTPGKFELISSAHCRNTWPSGQN